MDDITHHGSVELTTEEDAVYETGKRSCFRRFAGQVLGRPASMLHIRLPASFSRSASLPKRSAGTRTPTPHQSSHTTPPPRRQQQQPLPRSTESTRTQVKKRAASSSPSRHEGKRRSLRDLSRDYLPSSLLHFLQSSRRSLLGSEPHSSRHPSKPPRRLGPIGRHWVKVFDDIIYIDAGELEEVGVFAGYTGRPGSVPDAVPLPTPPTPPPPRQAPSRMSRGAATSAAVASTSTKGDDAKKIKLDLTDEEKIMLAYEERRKKVAGEAAKKELEEKVEMEKQVETEKKVTDKPPSVPSATSQGREVTRFKARKKKRPGTPIPAETTDENVDVSGISSTEVEVNRSESTKPDSEAREDTLEDDYIIPQAIGPSRPPRGHKIYDSIHPVSLPTQKGLPEPLATAQNVSEEKLVSETQTGVEISSDAATMSASVEIEPKGDAETSPQRPERGIKIYEKIDIKQVSSPEEKPLDNAQQSDETQSPINIESAEKGADERELVETRANLEKVETAEVGLPCKPQRGVKLYEKLTFPPKILHPPEQNDVQTITGQSFSFPETEVAPLQRPARGHKIYSSLKVEKITDEGECPVRHIALEVKPGKWTEISEFKFGSEDETRRENNFMELELATNVDKHLGSSETRGIGDALDTSTGNGESQSIPIKSERRSASYAKVHKDKSRSKMDVLALGHASDVPPPIPPKKRGIQPISPGEEPDVPVPPRPPRHLKPARFRPDTSPMRYKRQKIMVNGHTDIVETTADTSPLRPKRGSKIYSEIKVKGTDASASVVTSDGSPKAMFDDPPCKPSRHTHAQSSGHTPPRRKRPHANETLLATMSFETSKPSAIMVTADKDTYENVNVQENKKIAFARGKSRPLPPVPKQKQETTAGDNNKLSADKLNECGDVTSNTISNVVRDGATTAVASTTKFTTIANEDSESSQRVQSSQPNLAKLDIQPYQPSGDGRVGSPAVGAEPTESPASQDVSQKVDVGEGDCVATSGENQLDKDIENNLKKIESSFATLDTVLKSFQKYSCGTSGEPSRESSSSQGRGGVTSNIYITDSLLPVCADNKKADNTSEQPDNGSITIEQEHKSSEISAIGANNTEPASQNPPATHHNN